MLSPAPHSCMIVTPVPYPLQHSDCIVLIWEEDCLAFERRFSHLQDNACPLPATPAPAHALDLLVQSLLFSSGDTLTTLMWDQLSSNVSMSEGSTGIQAVRTLAPPRLRLARCGFMFGMPSPSHLSLAPVRPPILLTRLSTGSRYLTSSTTLTSKSQPPRQRDTHVFPKFLPVNTSSSAPTHLPKPSSSPFLGPRT